MLLITRDLFCQPFRNFTTEGVLKIPEEGITVGGFLSLDLSPQKKYRFLREYPWGEKEVAVRRHLLWCAREAIEVSLSRYFYLNPIQAMEDYLDGKSTPEVVDFQRRRLEGEGSIYRLVLSVTERDLPDLYEVVSLYVAMSNFWSKVPTSTLWEAAVKDLAERLNT